MFRSSFCKSIQIQNWSYLYVKAIYWIIILAVVFNQVLPSHLALAYAQNVLGLPQPGGMVSLSPAFMPAVIKGIKVFPDDPLRFDFIVDVGKSRLQGNDLKEESKKLIKYFLASLTVPEDDLWVNLSPYEKDRIIPNAFGVTEMGRDLLAQDYLLKQITSSLMYPENELGKKFWEKIYQKAYQRYGKIDIPVDTFNKVWIIPDKATVYEKETSGFVVASHLKVMLEQDYLARSKIKNQKSNINLSATNCSDAKSCVSTTEVIRELLIPEIEKEVNEGENFANLRQVYYSLILATWFKRNLKESLLGEIYMGKNKVAGVDVDDKDVKEKIYRQYLEAFRKGVYNYIKEDYDPGTQQMIPRKYFSGGVIGSEVNRIYEGTHDVALLAQSLKDSDELFTISANLAATGSTNAGDLQANAASISQPGELNNKEVIPISSNFLGVTGKFVKNKIGQLVLTGMIFCSAAGCANVPTARHESPEMNPPARTLQSGLLENRQPRKVFFLGHRHNEFSDLKEITSTYEDMLNFILEFDRWKNNKTIVAAGRDIKIDFIRKKQNLIQYYWALVDQIRTMSKDPAYNIRYIGVEMPERFLVEERKYLRQLAQHVRQYNKLLQQMGLEPLSPKDINDFMLLAMQPILFLKDYAKELKDVDLLPLEDEEKVKAALQKVIFGHVPPNWESLLGDREQQIVDRSIYDLFMASPETQAKKMEILINLFPADRRESVRLYLRGNLIDPQDLSAQKLVTDDRETASVQMLFSFKPPGNILWPPGGDHIPALRNRLQRAGGQPIGVQEIVRANVVGRAYDNNQRQGRELGKLFVLVDHENNQIILRGKEGKSLYDQAGRPIQSLSFDPVPLSPQEKESLLSQLSSPEVKKLFSAEEGLYLEQFQMYLETLMIYKLKDNTHGIRDIIPTYFANFIFLNEPMNLKGAELQRLIDTFKGRRSSYAETDNSILAQSESREAVKQDRAMLVFEDDPAEMIHYPEAITWYQGEGSFYKHPEEPDRMIYIPDSTASANLRERHIEVYEKLYKAFKENLDLQKAVPQDIKFVKVELNNKKTWGIEMPYVEGKNLETAPGTAVLKRKADQLHGLIVSTYLKVLGLPEISINLVSQVGGASLKMDTNNFVAISEAGENKVVSINPVSILGLEIAMAQQRFQGIADQLERSWPEVGKTLKRMLDEKKNSSGLVKIENRILDHSDSITPADLFYETAKLILEEKNLEIQSKGKLSKLWGRGQVTLILQSRFQKGNESVTIPLDGESLTTAANGKFAGASILDAVRVKIAEVTKDKAIVANKTETTVEPPGGIDFNPHKLNLETKGTKTKFNLPEDVPDFNNTTIDGLTPVIIQVIPVSNLPLWLGLNEEEQKFFLSKK